MPERKGNGDPPAGWILVVGVLGALLVLILIVGLQALYYHLDEAERVRKTYTQKPEELSRLRAEQQARLNSYRWIDRDEGVVAIPIEEAMKLVVAEYGEGAK